MPSDRQQKQSVARMREESDLSLEVVVLLIFGVFWLLFGLLLFKIYTGDLPYNLDSTYGLFLVIVSFQMITMGKTPFGDLRRSWALVVIGMGTAILGIATCFIPGYFTKFVSTLVGIVLFAGGIALFMQLCISERKARMWIKICGNITATNHSVRPCLCLNNHFRPDNTLSRPQSGPTDGHCRHVLWHEFLLSGVVYLEGRQDIWSREAR